VSVMEEIKLALTTPLTAEESATGTIEVEVERLLEPDTEANLKRFFYEQGWTEGLPFILPTEERVAEMLTGTSHAADEEVGTMQPSPAQVAWSYDVENVAIVAVMAGARPEHFPAILTLASLGQPAMPSSTTSMVRFAVFNGPIREELDMNMGIGAMGPYDNEACALIGRAWQLMTKCLGGSQAGTTYMGTFGNNYNYISPVFGENEERMPEGWLPFSVQQGFKSEDSVISVFTGWTLVNYGAYNDDTYADTMARMVNAFEFSGTSWHFIPDRYTGQDFWLVIDPSSAQVLKEVEGFDTKEELAQYIFDNSYYTIWDYWNAFPTNKQKGLEGEEPYASWLELPDGAYSTEHPMHTPPQIVVTGGSTNPYWYMIDGSSRASARVDDWE
jgi:hypothetical protein